MSWAMPSLRTLHVLSILLSGIVGEKTFLSRPDLRVPTWNIAIYEKEEISPGYWFVSPWLGVSQPAPYIYDSDGELIWSGYDRTTGAQLTSWDFRTVEINGTTAMSFYKGSQSGALGSGRGYIIDSTYTVQKEVIAGGRDRYVLDGHEFNVINDGKSVLVSIYEPKQADLSSLGLDIGMGWIWDCVFQELDMESGAVLFEWRSHDYIPIEHSENVLDPEYGEGRSFFTPFDYFHLNSIDKNDDGDYLISSRFMSTIYKISGSTGAILWQLGGTNSSFKMIGFNFSAQHDARYRDSRDGDEVITFFNNADNRKNSTRYFSSGMMVSLQTATARLMSEWVMPGPDSRTGSQGNIQILPNGNIFMGRGQTGGLSEFTGNGTCIMDARFENDQPLGLQSYRAYKFPAFVGTPMTLPDVYTYALTKSNPVSFFVSWNGATEVAAWDFYGGASSMIQGDFTLLGRVSKTGFETMFKTEKYFPFGYVAAIALNGSDIGRSLVQEINVMPADLTQSCGDDDCFIWPDDWITPVSVKDENHNEDEDFYFQIKRGWVVVYLLSSCGAGILLANLPTLLPKLARTKRRKNFFVGREKSAGGGEDIENLLSREALSLYSP